MSREKSDLDLWLTATYGDQVQREVRFHPVRKWRFDWLVRSVAIEYDGLIGGAAHTAIRKVANDAAKSNAAQLLGYTIIRVNAISLRDGSGYDDIERAVALRTEVVESERRR